MNNTDNPSPYAQYKSLKAKHPDAVLIFRNGNYYNVFQEDARTAAQVLGIKAYVENDPHDTYFWAGFPSADLDTALPRLIRAGHRVAICDLINPEPQQHRPEPEPTPHAEARHEPPSYDLFANDW